MSDGKLRKRDRFFKLLGLGQPESPAEMKTGLRSQGTGGSSTHTLAAASSVTFVASGSARLNETSMQSLITPTEPPLKLQPGGAIEDATSKSNPTSQFGPTPTATAAMDTTHTQEGDSTAAGSIQAQSLWSRATNSDGLSSQERKTLEDIGFRADSREMASAIRSMTAEILGEKKGELRDVGMKVLRWIDKFTQIGDTIVQFDPVHTALPWAGFRFLLQICLSKQENVDAILVGLEKTAYLIDRCIIYELLYTNGDSAASKNLEKSILRLYTAILKFLAKAIKMLNDNHLKAVFAGEISNYLDEVDQLEKTVGQDASVAEAQYSRAGFGKLRTLLDDINTTTSRLGSQIDSIEQNLEESKKSEILEWISNIPYTSHHRRIAEGRLAGTGKWLFEREEYRTWRSSSASKLLLLRGIPGAGKTYIASTVIDSLSSSPTPERLAYFYCNQAEENRREPQSILNTLVQQLAQTESGINKLLKPVVDIYRDREQKGQRSSCLSLVESQELLVQLTDIYPQTTICIDALDEVEPETRLLLLKAFKNIIEKSKNPVKIFATTRMDIDILRQLEMFPRIELQPDDNISDISRFVETKLQSISDDGLLLEGEVPDDLKVEICDVLCKRSRGMFQLAALQIGFICNMPTLNDVRRGLEALPDSLKDAYGEIYKRILDQKGSAPRLALVAFRWIQRSYEPLCSETLLDAITVEIGDQGEFSHRDNITVNGLLKVCQNLLIFDKQLDVFRFAHLSVDEYLETKLRKVDSHREIAKVCLSLLCAPGTWDTYDKTLQTNKGRYGDRHLLLYSAAFWPWHFARCGDMDGYQLLTLLWNKLMSETNHQRWLDYHRLSIKAEYTRDRFWRRMYALQQERNNPLSSVCVLGLSRMFTTISKSKPLTEKAPIDRLLLLAAKFGDLEIARLLIDEGANVSAPGKDEWTPLHVAAGKGHEAVARLLMDGGAGVSATGKGGSTPLLVAAQKGHEGVVRLLIDGGADVSVADKDGKTPLHGAAQNEHEAVARLLTGIYGGVVDISAADKDWSTPLHVAARYGRAAVARLLIDGGANASAADKGGSTPLHLAAQNGRTAVARLLIDGGANVSATDKHRSTPLHGAARAGHGAVVRLLIDGGADVSVADKNGRTPLHVALESLREEVSRLLVDEGADVSVADKNGQTPLHVALRKGHEAVARLLIDRGACVSVAGGGGQTPLHVAAQHGSEAVARLLMEGGADASAVAKDGQTPLHVAARHGSGTVVRLLMGGGVDVSAAAKDGQTPLHIALRNGHDAVARLLIGGGANASAADKDGRTPLHVAALHAREAVAQLLIDGGANVSAADKDGKTPLHGAVRSGHEAVARLLRDRGAT